MVSAFLLGVALSQPQTVTFTHPCAHSSVVLAALGEKLGTKMAPGGSVLRDYFAVKLTDRPVEEAMRVIAETLNAEWVRRGDYLVLDRGPKQEKAELDQENAAFKDGIERYIKNNPVIEFSLDKIREQMLIAKKAPRDPSLEYVIAPELTRLMPAARFGARIVRAMRDEMSKVTEGSPLRFYLRADGTTNMPNQVRQIVEDYKKEAAAVYELGVQLEAGLFIGGYGPSAPVPIGYSLVISRSQFSYEIAIRQDEFRGQNSFSRPGARFEVMRGAIPASSEPRIEIAPPVGKLPLSVEAACMMRTYAQRPNFPAPAVTPTQEDVATARRLGRDLVRNEPLALFGGFPLTMALDDSKRDYVAIVPDFYVFTGAMVRDGSIDPSRFKGYTQGLLITEDHATKILKVSSGLARIMRERRLDRQAGSTFLKETESAGHVTLDALADIVGSTLHEQGLYGSIEMLEPLMSVDVIGPHSYEALKLFSELTAVQRRSARAEGLVLSWGQLTKEVRSLFSRRLLSVNATFRAEEPGEPTSWIPGFMSYGAGATNGPLAFESEVPPDTTVRVRVYAKTLLRAGPGQSGRLSADLMTAEDFAKRSRTPPGEFVPDFTRAAIANVERLHVDVFVPGVGYYQMAQQVDDTTKDTKYVPLTQLPEPTRTQLVEAIKKLGGGQ